MRGRCGALSHHRLPDGRRLRGHMLCCTAASAARGDGGIHLSGGACPPSLSSSSSPNDEFSGVVGGGGEPLLLAQSVLLIFLLPAPDPLLLSARGPLLLPSLCSAGGRSGSGRGLVRPRSIHGHPLLKDDCQDRVGASQ
jgi:hypothetical protein